MRKLTSNLIALLVIVFTVTAFKSPNPVSPSSKKKIAHVRKRTEQVNPPKTKKLPVEKATLTLGFIKLTDMAPLAIAKFLGYFEEEGLTVNLEAQANWRDILDKVIDNQLDGAQMLAGQPIAAAVGCGRQAQLVTSYSMDLNGNAITVSNEAWTKMKDSIPVEYGKPVHPIPSYALKPVLNFYKHANKPFTFGIVGAYSTHNYQLHTGSLQAA